MDSQIINNETVCASRYIRGVYLFQEWKTAEGEVKEAIMQELLKMFDLGPEETEVVQSVVKSYLTEPDIDE